jgi:hypothetical protein
MDTDTLVEDQIDIGQRLIETLVEAGFDVAAAGWAKTSEDGAWSLYIASDRVDRIGAAAAYREVYGLSKSIPENWSLLSEVKLIGMTNPIARDLLAILTSYPARLPTRLRRSQLGGMAIDEAYLYPPPKAEGVGSRQSFHVQYSRQGKTNAWKARTKRVATYRGMKAKGAVGYSTARWEGEKPEDEDFAIVSVLLEVDPGFDEANPFLTPDVWQVMTEQARALADEMFKQRHPDAVIEHVDGAVP